MDNILIVVPDITRKAHLKTVLPRVLSRLKRKGFKNKKIKIIVATGLHKPHTNAELLDLVGKKIFSRYRVITHRQDKRDLVYKGKTKKVFP
ncbi:MAG: lactate racemase domain-containing protein [Candidatus Omnitrophica bacterium]|nr:lactate racemase domain-containing protein [Candidatus Omnitrophota bacterium]